MEMVLYGGGEHLQDSSGSLVNKSGQFLTHCPVSGPSRFSCCSISWGQGSRNPKHTWFLLPSSFPLPALVTLFPPVPKYQQWSEDSFCFCLQWGLLAVLWAQQEHLSWPLLAGPRGGGRHQPDQSVPWGRERNHEVDVYVFHLPKNRASEEDPLRRKDRFRLCGNPG